MNTWTDSSGNGNNAVFTQVGGVGVAPLYETNVYNGMPVVRFGGNSLLQVSSLTMGAYTIAAVFKVASNSPMIVYEHSDNVLSNLSGNFLYTLQAEYYLGEACRGTDRQGLARRECEHLGLQLQHADIDR